MIGQFNILVVDGDAETRMGLAVSLQVAGYEVRTATSGEAGVVAIDSYPPDMIAIAMRQTGGMDGFALAEYVRNNQQTRFMPIILYTPDPQSERDMIRSAEVGALGFVADLSNVELILARARVLLEFKNYLDSCEELALTDHLTGLANRRRFERQLEREVERTTRYGRPFCLVYADIDHFKQVNDTFGHAAGDEALKMLAKTLMAGTRGVDVAARLGGEEFAIILTETDIDTGFEVTERLRRDVREMIVPQVGHITSSFGIAQFPLCAKSAAELVEAADVSLYTAKEGGRDRTEIAPLLTEKAVETVRKATVKL